MTISRKKAPLTFQYSINGRCLSAVNCYKYLGLIITSDLRWNEHITFIEKKAMKKLGYLRRSLRQSTQEIKLLAYKTYIRPLLEYACVVWDPYTKKNIDKLENLQRKSARFIFRSYNRLTSVTALLQTANLEALHLRRYRERLKYMYLLYHDKLGIDSSAYIEKVVRRPTRADHSKKLQEFSCRTNSYMGSFFPRTVREWNRLPGGIVEAATVASFLSELKNL